MWSEFSECSLTCGVGSKVRQRICVGGNPGDPGCIGSDINTMECNTQVSKLFKILHCFYQRKISIFCRIVHSLKNGVNGARAHLLVVEEKKDAKEDVSTVYLEMKDVSEMCLT